MDPGQAIVMGREDYTVRSMHVRSGVEVWNATFSRFMRLGAKAPAAGELGGAAAAPPPPLPRFTVSADNSLQAYDAETGFQLWSIAFDAPPVAAFSSLHQGLNHLDPAAVLGGGAGGTSAAVPGGAPRPLPGASGGGSAVASRYPHWRADVAKVPGQLQPRGAGGVPGAWVLVGALKGIPYVLPADHLLMDEQMLQGAGMGTSQAQLPGWGASLALGTGDEAAPAVPALLGPGAAEAAPGLCMPGEAGSASSSGDTPGSTALAPLAGQGAVGQVISLMREDGDGGGLSGQLVCPPGLHLIDEPSPAAPPVSWLPNNATKPAPPPLPQAPQSMVLRLPLAVQLTGLVAAMAALVAVGWVASRAHSRNQSKAQLQAAAALSVPPSISEAASAASLASLAAPSEGMAVSAAAAGSADGGAQLAAPPASPHKESAAAGGAATVAGGSGSGAAATPNKRKKKGGRTDGGASSSASMGGGEADSGSNHSANSAPNGAPAAAEGAVQAPAPASADGNGVKAGLPNGKANGKAAGKSAQNGLPHSQDAGMGSQAGFGRGSAAGEAGDAGQARTSAGGRARGAEALERQASASGSGAGPVNGRVARLQPDGSLVIGRLRVGPGILGYGSAGTVVYEGVMDGRAVAVKRLLRQFYDLAKKEIEVLIMSDEHPNVVRCFAMEEDREFVYLALERCRSTLNELLGSPGGRAAMLDNAGPTSGLGSAFAAAAVSGPPLPSARCLELMHQVAQGLAALHERGIVHRDLKPHNVLITDAGRAKLSDMGLSKQLVAEQSSFESHGAGGSSGWQAPEQLIARGGGAVRQTRAMDVFSLGCVLHYCLTGGLHPFGDSYARDGNILHQPPNLTALAAQPEAANLLAAMLLKEPGARPSMGAVLSHPLWWSAEQRLQFLVDISDRVENEDREPDQTLLAALESHAASGIGGNWGALVDPQLVANLGRYRRYDYTSLRDLLRVVRNKRSHFREMPSDLQAMLGPLPSGFLRYFASRFPGLLTAVYVFGLRHLRDEPSLSQYWPCGAAACEPFLAMFAKTARPSQPRLTALLAAAKEAAKDAAAAAAAAAGAAAAAVTSTAGGGEGAAATTAQERSPDASAHGRAAAAGAANGSSSASGDGDDRRASSSASSAVPTSSNGSTASADSLAAPPGGQPAAPAPAASSPAPAPSPAAVVVGYEVCGDSGPTTVVEFPQRPGKQTCDFYVKTGHCKFGDGCMFDHPTQHSVPRTALGLPLRPDQPVCAFYLKNNECKFGAACRFHHPVLRPIYAGSARGGTGST